MRLLRSFKILTIVFFHTMLIHLTGAPSPGIQTSTFDGIPSNWFNNIDAEPFVRIGSKYYYFETRHKANWFQAAHICRTLRANLVTIEHHAEFEAITHHISEKRYDPSNYYWTAFNDLSVEGEFVSFATGMLMRYNGFSSGNPDNTHDIEHCVHIWFINSEYSMNDLDCKALTHYICQAENPKTISFTVW